LTAARRGNPGGVHLRNGHGQNGRDRVARIEHHVGATAKEVAEHASALTRLELELAALELRRKAAEIAAGTALSVAAAVLSVLALGFACAAAAAGLAGAMPWWAALLVVAGGLLALAAIFGLVGLARLRKATPPVPERAIREAQLTREAIGR
jgi:hypothetical protein